MTNNLPYYLRKRNMTQSQLSEDTGITQATISRYVSGDRIPTVEFAIKMADALSCDVDELYNSNVDADKMNLSEVIQYIFMIESMTKLVLHKTKSKSTMKDINNKLSSINDTLTEIISQL